MLKSLATLLALALSLTGFAQVPFKGIPPAQPTNLDVSQLDFRTDLIPAGNRAAQSLDAHKVTPLQLTGVAGVQPLHDGETNQVFALRGRPTSLADATPTKEDAWAYLELMAPKLGLADARRDVFISGITTDALGQTHARLEQRHRGISVYPADARLHATTDRGFDRFTGRFSPVPADLSIVPTVTEQGARTQVRAEVEERWVDLPAEHLPWVSGPQLEAALIIYAPYGEAARLAWKVGVRPNLVEHQVHILDAETGATISANSHLCGFRHDHGAATESSSPPPGVGGLTAHRTSGPAPAANTMGTTRLPPTTATRPNLYDQLQTINTFDLQDTFYLLDGTREMFTTTNGTIDGFLLTYDGLGGSPQRNDFNPGIAVSLNNNDWSRTAVSVHANAGASYQYFRDKFNRNSIDGQGGNVYSFMNINETDGTEMDNAFWNGRALFYGNGLSAFSRLPRGLDVAGHEMAHGVIQSTANLVYENQPGALNESFADVFGYLVEGETGDYRIGEDVVRTNVFPSGAMRNLQDPNNGGSGPSDFRWQPAHMDEFRTLPNTPDGDNGGVHINSGIPNRAFYLFSSDPAVGDTRAEQVYYRALNVYLTRSARFIDLREAVVQAADDLYDGSVVAAANAAFDTVGIGGTGGNGGSDPGPDPTADLETNEGDRFLLLTNTAQAALFRAQEDGLLIDNPLVEVSLSSKPSITDDGTAAVFIDDQNRVRVYNFATSQLTFLENNPQMIWRNVVVSKDGQRLALTTTDNDNDILIFDFASGTSRAMALFNPTTASGITTGDVQYADALEWDPAGEFLMYDALSRLDDGLEFWDIGFLRAWDNDAGNFGDGNIFKLVNDLPEDISIGNPTFSKNSPYIIAFEEVDFSAGTFTLTAANIETGTSATVFTNAKVNYPNYGISDDRICFDADDTGQNAVLAVRSVGADKITPAGNATILVPGGHWGVFYATGERGLDTALDGPVVEDDRVKVYPTATSGQVTIEVPAEPVTVPLRVFDQLGRQVMATPRPVVRGTVELGALPAGSYFLAIPLAEGVVVRRVIVR